jgi:hypothetical protein
MTQPASHFETVAHIRPEEYDIRRTGHEFQRLYRIETGIELGGARLGRQEQRRRNENSNAVCGDERHALDLRANKTSARAIRQPKARPPVAASAGMSTKKPHGRPS